jgi:ADP-ribose pyrophosphatase
MPSFKLLRSETLLEGRAFKVRRDFLQTPDGRETRYDIIEHTGSVVMVPIDEHGNVLFVRQYRHAAGSELLELPAGTLDEDEAYEACAAREMREETGMAAGSLEKVGEFFLVPGYSTEFMAVYIATALRPDPLPTDADEFLRVEPIPVQEALRMAESGAIPDAKSLAALMMARSRLLGLS